MSARRPATATDVAKKAGVSQSAVSRAFTPGASVSGETRAKVEAAARALGYRPNAIARSLITRRSRVIAVVAAYLQNHFYPDVLEALSEQLQARGYHILLFTADVRGAADPVLEEILRHRADAVILASTTLSSKLARECRAAGLPVLLFNRTTETADVSSVTGENERGGRLIAEFLHACGHERPAFIAGVENSSTSREREAGFRAGLADVGLALHAREVGHYRFDGAEAAARALFSMRTRPDAIFCGNDHQALAVTEVAKANYGLRIPEDVALVGFDDVGPARWPSFSLTTFSQPVRGMVERAVDTVIELIETPDAPARRDVVPGELVVRGSTRRPKDCVSLGEVWVWRSRRASG